MAAKSRSQIIGDLEDYISRSGGSFGEWYVGCTGQPSAMLFKTHGVRKTGDAWVSRLAKDEVDAHDVVEYFLTTRKTRGRRKDKSASDLYVYAFKIKSHTKV